MTPLVVAAKLPRRQTNEHTNRRASLLRKASLRGGERGLTSLSQFKINTNVRIGSDAACGWVSIRHSWEPCHSWQLLFVADCVSVNTPCSWWQQVRPLTEALRQRLCGKLMGGKGFLWNKSHTASSCVEPLAPASDTDIVVVARDCRRCYKVRDTSSLKNRRT